MPLWITNLIAAIMLRVVTILVQKGLEVFHGKQKQAKTEQEIDARLAKLKAASLEAFDGKPITPEQRQKLRGAIAEFIGGNAPNGGL